MSRFRSVQRDLPAVAFFIIVAVGASLTSRPAAAQLSYAEGGPAEADPGQKLAPDLRRYVDTTAGNDTKDGKSPATAWKTLGKLNGEKGNLKPGTHVLLKRGQDHDGSLYLSGIHGSPGQRIVIGAYGDPSLPRPHLSGTASVSQGSHLMVRELDCVKLDASGGAHHVVIFDNVVHGNPKTNNYPSNGIRIFGASHHISVVSNLVYDLKANDCIVVHPTGTGESARDSHWIVDNVTIGNAGMEDGVDLAMSELDGGDPHIARDIKVVGNRIQMKALAGLSTMTGRGSKCISAGHEGQYIWIVGNTMGGSQHIGLNFGADKRYFHVSGNVAFANANNNSKVSVELHPQDLRTEHNTLIHTMANRGVVKLAGTQHHFVYNLLIRTQPGGNLVESSQSPPASTIAAMDHNHYGYDADPKVANLPFAQWQTSSGLDKSSSVGPVPGVTAPQAGTYEDDPHNWKDAKFLAQLIPDSSFKACAGANTPGAFDCTGKRLGMSIDPLPGLDNNGYGWAGPPLVQAKLKELGVSFGGSSPGSDGGGPLADAGAVDGDGPLPPTEGGAPTSDGPTGEAGIAPDSGVAGQGEDGCSCRVSAVAAPRPVYLLALIVLTLLLCRRC